MVKCRAGHPNVILDKEWEELTHQVDENLKKYLLHPYQHEMGDIITITRQDVNGYTYSAWQFLID